MITVAFQGAAGAYSELALRACFGTMPVQSVPRRTFHEVFAAVTEGQVDFGVLPFENALTGSIHENFDNLLLFPELTIGAEYRLRIRHSLIGLPGATLDGLREVLSHPQGLAQCAQWLARYPQWKPVSFYDTAGAVEHVAKTGDPGLAAIASSLAAQTYGMEVLAEGIETNPRNYTRFWVLQRPDRPFAKGQPVPAGAATKASVVFGLADRPGSLLAVLQKFADATLNMSKIESRPIHGKPFEYNFYVDLAANGNEAALATILDLIEPAVSSSRLLGIFPVLAEAAS